MVKIFQNRTEAGQLLARTLGRYANRSDVLVLALPRGGVPVAFEVPKALDVVLDIIIVRKLGLPDQPELAMGAIATGGVIVLNQDVVQFMIEPREIINEVAAKERRELERRELRYRGARPLPEIAGKTVIVIDDGIATGSTMRAAIKALQQQRPAHLIVATPTAPPSVCDELRREVDELICLTSPEPFYAIGLWYEDFSQTTDEEVCNLLALSVRFGVAGKKEAVS